MTDPREYGKALFLLTEEQRSTERVRSEIADMARLIAENPDYPKLLDTPALPKAERIGLISKAFDGFDEGLVNLLKIMAEGRMSYLFPKVAAEYSALYDESRGIQRVEAISAVALTDEQLSRLRAKLTRLTGKTVIIENTLDPALLGGMKLRYGGVQLDGSVKTRLDALEKSLSEIVI